MDQSSCPAPRAAGRAARAEAGVELYYRPARRPRAGPRAGSPAGTSSRAASTSSRAASTSSRTSSTTRNRTVLEPRIEPPEQEVERPTSAGRAPAHPDESRAAPGVPPERQPGAPLEDGLEAGEQRLGIALEEPGRAGEQDGDQAREQGDPGEGRRALPRPASAATRAVKDQHTIVVQSIRATATWPAGTVKIGRIDRCSIDRREHALARFRRRRRRPLRLRAAATLAFRPDVEWGGRPTSACQSTRRLLFNRAPRTAPTPDQVVSKPSRDDDEKLSIVGTVSRADRAGRAERSVGGRRPARGR
jgi:hypothetical protein